jgi:hypothetical protein
MDYFMPKNYSLSGKPDIEQYVKENMLAIANFSKTNNEDIKKFIDSLGETVLKKMINKYDSYKGNNIQNQSFLKRQRKRSGKSKQEMSKFYYLNTKVIELNDDAISLSNRKSSMFDETNSLSACVLSSPNMSPSRINDNNILPDIFINNPSEVYQYDHFYELAAFKQDDPNSKSMNNIYEV